MKVTFTDLDGKVHKIPTPELGSTGVVLDGVSCPHCKMKNMIICGTGKKLDPENRHDTYKATAVHKDNECEKKVGILRVKVNTLFGLEEDTAVFRSGVKIY